MSQIITYVKEEMKKTSISEQTMIGIIWTSVMSSVEWNKKEELVTEQAIKLLKVRHCTVICKMHENKLKLSNEVLFSYKICSKQNACGLFAV